DKGNTAFHVGSVYDQRVQISRKTSCKPVYLHNIDDATSPALPDYLDLTLSGLQIQLDGVGVHGRGIANRSESILQPTLFGMVKRFLNALVICFEIQQTSYNGAV